MPIENNHSSQTIIEDIWNDTCGSWQNCTEKSIQSFLTQCQENNIDPQYCMGWVEQHKEQIPDWQSVSKGSLDWINQHTSTGSPISINNQDLR
ncbi:hypothetical protein [Scopulibacillus cellulosilyticus]|uniref:Uncharacterized protein n=1 Tax=Scopulibacillus cellulosilyticus TaxID=2665665 RepID=A0ABW2Q1H1_9BACL